MSSGAPPASGAPAPPPADPARIDTLAQRLCLKLPAIDSDELRARAAAAELASLSSPEAVLLLGRLLRRARDRPVAALTTAALARALARGLVDPEFVAACLAAARSLPDRLAEAFFASGPAGRVYDANDEQFVDRRMRALPLGQRRALTRARDVDLLNRLAHDQDPRVIRQLLLNPRLTEREAVVVASRRPTHVPVLEEVLASRFGTSPRVRLSIAHNPYAPLALAVRALTGLPSSALKEVASSERVSPEVRRHARSLLTARRPTPAERERRPSPELTSDDPELQSLLDALSSATPPEELDVVALDPDGQPLN